MCSTYPEKLVEKLYSEIEALRARVKELEKRLSDKSWQEDYDWTMDRYRYSDFW